MRRFVKDPTKGGTANCFFNPQPMLTINTARHLRNDKGKKISQQMSFGNDRRERVLKKYRDE